MNLPEITYNSLKKISFSERFKSVVDKSYTGKNYMSKIKSSEVLAIFQHFGYKLTFKDKSFYLIEEYNNYKFQITFQLKHGSVLCYIFIWSNDMLIDIEQGHFTFLRNKISKTNEFIAPGFSNSEELKIILIDFLSIYEDFKKEFLQETLNGG